MGCLELWAFEEIKRLEQASRWCLSLPVHAGWQLLRWMTHVELLTGKALTWSPVSFARERKWVLITGEGSSLSSRENTVTLNSAQYLMRFLCSGTSKAECNCIIRSRLPKAFYLRWLHLLGMPEYQGLLQLQPSSLGASPPGFVLQWKMLCWSPAPHQGCPWLHA